LTPRYWNLARQRYSRLSAPCIARYPSLLTALHLPGPHTRAKSRLLAVGGQNPARRGLSAGGNRIRTIGTAEKETAVESGPAADHRRLARRPVLNDPIQLIGSASLVGNSRETFHKSGTARLRQVPDLFRPPPQPKYESNGDAAQRSNRQLIPEKPTASAGGRVSSQTGNERQTGPLPTSKNPPQGAAIARIGPTRAKTPFRGRGADRYPTGHRQAPAGSSLMLCGQYLTSRAP